MYLLFCHTLSKWTRTIINQTTLRPVTRSAELIYMSMLSGTGCLGLNKNTRSEFMYYFSYPSANVMMNRRRHRVTTRGGGRSGILTEYFPRKVRTWSRTWDDELPGGLSNRPLIRVECGFIHTKSLHGPKPVTESLISHYLFLSTVILLLLYSGRAQSRLPDKKTTPDRSVVSFAYTNAHVHARNLCLTPRIIRPYTIYNRDRLLCALFNYNSL